jgi:transposase-like protein
MPKGVPNKKYSSEFKQIVVETMRRERLSYHEAARQFEISDHHRVMLWERIFIEEGPEGLYIERRGRAGSAAGVQKGRKPKLDKKIEEDLIAENQRLRAENDYLKKLNALVLEEERQSRRRK